MTTGSNSLRVRPQDLKSFEPQRLGTRTPSFSRLIERFGGLKQSEIISLIDKEIAETSAEADLDLDQIAYSAALLILRDYITSGVYPIASGGSLFLANLLDSDALSPEQHRQLLKKQYESARDRALRDRGKIDWLRDSLRALHKTGYRAHELIHLLGESPPQVRLIDTRGEMSGLPARSVWRSVRATWSMGPEASAPGREVAFLAVDDRCPETPLGILQFRNVVPGISQRDLWLGISLGHPELSGTPGIGYLGMIGKGKIAQSRINGTKATLKALLQNLNREGIEIPFDADHIEKFAELSKSQRQQFDTSRKGGEQGLKNQHLVIQKRAQTAHDLLRGIRGLDQLLINVNSGVLSATHRSDIEAGLKKLWHYHMGFVAMEMSICGAAPPFGPMRVGKLVAALAGTREVVEAWGYDRPLGQIAQEVYLPQVRDAVPNPGPLVVFTSGLYPGHSAQYSRVRSGGTAWKKIGETSGFGSFHISFETTEKIRELNEAVDGYQHITRAFGEGSGARFRSVGKGISYLGLPDLRKHETKRPMYALPLVENCREVLLGWEAPRRIVAPPATQIGSDWWQRWFEPRKTELEDKARRAPDLEATLAGIIEPES